MKRRIDENQKVTLTLGQLKRLVKEERERWRYGPRPLYSEINSRLSFNIDAKEPTTDEIVKELENDEYGYTVDVVSRSAKRDVIAVKNEYNEYCKVEVEFDPYIWSAEQISKQAYNDLIKSKSDETKIDENQKTTLTIEQLKRLVRESFNEGLWAERDEMAYDYKSYVPNNGAESPLDAGFYFKDEDDAYDFGNKGESGDETSHVHRETVNGEKYWVVYFY